MGSHSQTNCTLLHTEMKQTLHKKSSSASFFVLCLIINSVQLVFSSECRDSEPITWGNWTENVLEKTCKGYEFVNLPGVDGFVFKTQNYEDDYKVNYITHASKMNITMSNITETFTKNNLKFKIINTSGYPDEDSSLKPEMGGLVEADFIISKLFMNYTATAHRYEYDASNDTLVGEFRVETTIDTDIKWLNEFFLLTPEAKFLNFDVTLYVEKCSPENNSDPNSPRCHRRLTITNSDLVIAQKTYRYDYFSTKNNGFKVEVREVSTICWFTCYTVPFYKGTLFLEGNNVKLVDINPENHGLTSRLYWIDDKGLRTDFGDASQARLTGKLNEYIEENYLNETTTQMVNEN